MNDNFWMGKKVLITGHTGFKGSWLCTWLRLMGAEVTGFSLPPKSDPNLFTVAEVERNIRSIIGNIQNYSELKNAITSSDPEIIFHMAAQAFVRYSYVQPVETYLTNVMGTVNLLEAVRSAESVKTIVNVTTDKCYEDQDWVWGYREIDRLGGYDPYSSSKTCSEIVTSAYRSSFFTNSERQISIATARAGNVIGGGDWSADRLIPDAIKAFNNNNVLNIRNPNAIRPWQHVLEPLAGYLKLAEKLCTSGDQYAGAWNFGPNDVDAISVESIIKIMASNWKQEVKTKVSKGNHPHETNVLKLDNTKSKEKLQWKPRLSINKSIELVLEWNNAYIAGEKMKRVTENQIENYMKAI
jgi:CDP-glucose 4,6-dehydratase